MFEFISGLFDKGGFLSTVGNAIGTVAPIISAGASLFAGNEAKKTSYASADDILRIAERESQETLVAGYIQSKQIQSAGKKEIGMAVARAGASGLQIRGSILDKIGNSYAELEMDRLNTLYSAYRESELLMERARADAASLKSEGKATLTRSITSSVGSLATLAK